jgi:hypothetical protein
LVQFGSAVLVNKINMWKAYRRTTDPKKVWIFYCWSVFSDCFKLIFLQYGILFFIWLFKEISPKMYSLIM